ncbi:ribonuclease H-like domain-containing protein [Tanacetum coccineum]
MVPRAVLMKSGLVSVNIARQVNAAHSKITVNATRPKSHFSKPALSTVKRPIHKNTTFKNNNFNQRVNTVKDKNVNTVKAVKASACWVWKPKTKVVDYVSKHNSASITLKKFDYGNPQRDLQDQEVIDSGCLRHMTGDMSYLTDFEEIDRGYVAFGGNPKGGKITGRELKFNLFSVSQMCDKKNSVLFNDTECIILSPNIKLTDESHVLLKVPRKNNMYSVDLKNVVPKGGLTCLFAKATSDESALWHRRLGHINFKTMNKLVKGNLVRGLPSKLFENNQTCVACQKGKQHRASNQSNSNTGTKACDDAGKARMETIPGKDYILLPLWTTDLPFSQISKSSPNDGSKPSSDDRKRDLHLEDAEGVDCLPNATIFEKLTLIGGPTDNVADEAVNEEMDDSLEMDATTATSLDAEYDRGNIDKTQSKATLNEPSSLGTSSGSGLRHQETMRDTISQTGFENVSKHSNDPLLARGNTLRSDEDRLKLEELMEFCTKLQQRVLNLENTKIAQAQEITSLKVRVKKLEKKG